MARDAVLDWLMEGDASIRWQALRDLVGSAGRTWERERRPGGERGLGRASDRLAG